MRRETGEEERERVGGETGRRRERERVGGEERETGEEERERETLKK